jgi:solute carrier family 24 (sodium/potassium/calcium exchanger), member 6
VSVSTAAVIPSELHLSYLAEDTLSVPTVPASPRLRAHSNPTFPSQSTSDRDPRLSLSIHLTPGRPRRDSHSTQHMHNLPSYSLLGALEFRNAVNLLRQQSSADIDVLASPITPYAAGHYHNSMLAGHTRRDSQLSEREGDSNPWESALGGVALGERHNADGPHNATTLHSHPNHPHPKLSTGAPSVTTGGVDGATRSSIVSSYMSPILEQPPRATSKRQRVKTAVFDIFHTLFPTLHDFTQKSIIGMVASLFAAPAVLLLTLTLPVVVIPMQGSEVAEKVQDTNAPTLGNLIDFEEEGVERALVAEDEVEEEMHDLEFNKWLMAVQCICGPLFCVSVLFGVYTIRSHRHLLNVNRRDQYPLSLANTWRWIDRICRGHTGDNLRKRGKRPGGSSGSNIDGIPRRHSMDHGYSRRSGSGPSGN